MTLHIEREKLLISAAGFSYGGIPVPTSLVVLSLLNIAAIKIGFAQPIHAGFEGFGQV